MAKARLEGKTVVLRLNATEAEDIRTLCGCAIIGNPPARTSTTRVWHTLTNLGVQNNVDRWDGVRFVQPRDGRATE